MDDRTSSRFAQGEASTGHGDGAGIVEIRGAFPPNTRPHDGADPGLIELFDEILKRDGAMLRRIASSYEANPHVCEELVQNILFAVWQALPSFRAESSLRSYVARIAHNRGSSHVASELSRVPTTELSYETPSDEQSPFDETEVRLSRERLQAAIRDLPVGMREVAVLTLEDFTPAEIAGVLGLTPNIVSIRLNRAKAQLKRKLATRKHPRG